MEKTNVISNEAERSKKSAGNSSTDFSPAYRRQVRSSLEMNGKKVVGCLHVLRAFVGLLIQHKEAQRSQRNSEFYNSFSYPKLTLFQLFIFPVPISITGIFFLEIFLQGIG